MHSSGTELMTRNTLETLRSFVVIVAVEERNYGKLSDELEEIGRIFITSFPRSLPSTVASPTTTHCPDAGLCRCGRRRSRTQRSAGCM